MVNRRRAIDLSAVTLAVLAGGCGTRMGLAKSRLQIEGTPILAWLLEKLQWPGPTLLVTAPAVAHPPGSERFDREVIDPADGLGPLRGVLTALENMTTPIAAVVTVDMPAVKREMLAWLIEAADARPAYNGLMCAVNRGKEKDIEPFPSVFRAAGRPSVAQQLSLGRRSVQGLLSQESFHWVDAPAQWPHDAWTNLNTPEDLAMFNATKAVVSRQDL
jgi:molybdenum cofactor guanylyltransferase